MQYTNIPILHTGQPSTTLLPQGHQKVCHGESISYTCTGNGNTLELYCPNIINESDRFTFFANESPDKCFARSGYGYAYGLTNFAGSPVSGGITLIISEELITKKFTVFCRVIMTAGQQTLYYTSSATFSVLGKMAQ